MGQCEGPSLSGSVVRKCHPCLRNNGQFLLQPYFPKAGVPKDLSQLLRVNCYETHTHTHTGRKKEKETFRFLPDRV